MSAGKLILAWVACCALSVSGCAAWPNWSRNSQPALTSEQQAWWDANRQRAITIPGRGLYIEGAGYFDENGHPLSDLAKAQSTTPPHRPKEDPYEGWLYKRMTGQDQQAASTAAAAAPNGAVPASYSASNAPALPGQSANAPYPSPSSKSEEESPSGLALFYPSNVTKSWAKLTGRDKDEKTAQTLYDEGESLFRQAKYPEAAAKFNAAVKHWPDSAVEEDGMFLLAECEFFTDKYDAANDDFGELLKKYPNSRHLDKVVARRFAIARYWQQVAEKSPHWPVTPNFFNKELPWFDTDGNAMATFDRVRIEDPTGPLADDAIMATASAYFVKGRFIDADYYYGLIRRDYPKSEHLLNAYKLGLQAKLRKYQGPEYDGSPLVEAEELIDQMMLTFPRELGDERERLLLAKKEVHAQLAARDYRMAEYYYKGSHYGAARYYYAGIIKKYPDSSFAQLAQQRVESFKSEPDNPPDRLEFLTRWLGEEKNPNAVANKDTGTTTR